ncbi:DNA repair protein RecN [Sandaracinobacteroides saxicola]|uniref:DNA repair protein RecN n=1 Tax=Sandaracinobacteroides saxicola TaxID=2759707 RepID=A0A7G5IEA9_9SPHN|nr:DNA repair protein RecN [Sandaracinobacteroides saxicola]QMW21701.1 DNA repair protein RecN [Sandaracinobacteroides saxicola]
MLTRLSLRDVVLIASVDLELAGGLTVLTGETGAGKSILLDGLGLVLGDRADAGLVRHGAAQAVVSAAFAPPAGHGVRALLQENGLEQGEELLLRRVVKADGGSRAFVNDLPVSAALLREVGAALVEVHGQHDDRGLLAPKGHRALLDAFGGCNTAAVAAAWAAASAARAALLAAEEALANAARDREWLSHAVTELRALAPRPGEEAELAEARARMQRGARLADDLLAVEALVSGGDGALSQLRQAGRRLERLAEADAGLAAALAAVDRALVEGDEVEAGLAAAREALSFTPDDLEATEARLFELRAMARKHRVAADDLAALAGELGERAAAIEAGEGGLKPLRAAVVAAEKHYAAAADGLSEARTAAAARLDGAVNAELPALKLEAARFRTRVERAEPGPAGQDGVLFEVATNTGATFGPLTKIASGGEMSRFVLALKVALASEGAAGTLIFDEIDRGVGGATASAIGARLARVAAGAQVIVVTHSPQVAAAGAQHLVISKATGPGGVRTEVVAVTGAARREELARMLSGDAVSDEARAAAEKLLA